VGATWHVSSSPKHCNHSVQYKDQLSGRSGLTRLTLKESCQDGMTEQWPIAHRSTNTPKCDMVRPQVVASYARPPIARSKRRSSPGSPRSRRSPSRRCVPSQAKARSTSTRRTNCALSTARRRTARSASNRVQDVDPRT
jgi:hypothetical protein